MEHHVTSWNETQPVNPLHTNIAYTGETTPSSIYIFRKDILTHRKVALQTIGTIDKPELSQFFAENSVDNC